MEVSVVNVAVVIGSLRRDSINRGLALALQKLAEPAGLDFRLIEIGDLPHYNDDLWANPPPRRDPPQARSRGG
jgi:chromate reductase